MLILVRHGECVSNVNRQLLGRAESPLTSEGVRQMKALRPYIGPVATLTSSPLERAVESAEILCAGVGIEIDPSWIEVDYGDFDLVSLKDLPLDVVRRSASDPNFEFNGGESWCDVRERVERACVELFAREGERARSASADVVVVSHVTPIKAAVAWATGVASDVLLRLHLSNGSLTRISWRSDRPYLLSFNERPCQRRLG
ncbi:MAG: histidine phosphatase family protein [Actinobacteria bacterium]|nr:histidine phosphatase family protein [Actinomycetota bacterium]MCL5445742.1 histidine phosphatase family protein [Actinomycetota bacterium]